ncbi:hypothetical protein K0M31_010763 [Melipona bicolor]|uniref:Uncharacterized protein n=1 Tax=Melipona bicolor TaxID=60889 RepID=A0AA40FKU1_9HYME|nr:hypothetical protein K0M31_010763 [Melipona bicolor]
MRVESAIVIDTQKCQILEKTSRQIQSSENQSAGTDVTHNELNNLYTSRMDREFLPIAVKSTLQRFRRKNALAARSTFHAKESTKRRTKQVLPKRKRRKGD